MRENNGLKHFLRNTLIPNRRERLIGFLASEKGFIKFSKSLDHDLEKFLDKTKLSLEFSEFEFEQAGYLYCSSGAELNKEGTIANLYKEAPWVGGWLIISKSGELAIYRPEGRIDDELYFKLQQS